MIVSRMKAALGRRGFGQALQLTALYSAPVLVCLYLADVFDADVWWHLKTGAWILAHRAVPYADPFMTPVHGQPWAAYSWLFEVLMVRLYAGLGLSGILAYTAGMVFAITLAVEYMVGRLKPECANSLPLSAAACLCLAHLYTPRPWLFSILFFVLVLTIIMQARQTRATHLLLWLPLIFALWANLHIQFIEGLILLVLALAESVIVPRLNTSYPVVKPGVLAIVLVACLGAVCVNPYGWNIYKVAYDLASQPGVFYKLTELEAMPFRDIADYCVLFFGVAAVAALARRGRFLFFESGLLLFGFVVSFRSRRDLWVLVISAAAILAASLPRRYKTAAAIPLWSRAAAALATVIVLVGGSHLLHNDNERFSKIVEINMPVRAVAFIKQRGYSGPVYNLYDWGGYLTWNLAQPITIDGRAALYGDERFFRNIATWNAAQDWASDTALTGARVVIGPVQAPLTQVLRLDNRYKLVYEDKLSAVFIKNRGRRGGS